MAFLEGLVGGLGQGAKQVAHNMLEAQLNKYRSAGRIWEAMASDENFHPNIRMRFMRTAQDLYGTDPYNKQSIQKAKQHLSTDPTKAAQEAYKAMELLGEQPKYYNAQGYRGAAENMQYQRDLGQQELDLGLQKKRSEAQIELDMIPKRLEMITGQSGGMDFPVGVEPTSPLGQLISNRRAMEYALKLPREPIMPQTLTNGQPGWAFSGGFFGMNGQPLSQTGATRGIVPTASTTQVDVDPLTGRTVTVSRRGPAGGAPPPQNTFGVPVSFTAQPQIPPGAAPLGNPASAPVANNAAIDNGAPPILPGTDPGLVKKFPGVLTKDPIDSLAFAVANRQLSADDLKGKPAEVLASVLNRLQQGGVLLMDDKEYIAAKDLKQSEGLLLQMSTLLDKIIQDPLGSAWAGIDDEYNRLRDSVGALFARDTFKQVGALAVLEQEWAKAGLYGGKTAALAGVLDRAGVPRWTTSARNSLQHIHTIIQRSKDSWLKARSGDYIPGIGPKDEYLATPALFPSQESKPAAPTSTKPATKVFTEGPYKGRTGVLNPDGQTYTVQ